MDTASIQALLQTVPISMFILGAGTVFLIFFALKSGVNIVASFSIGLLLTLPVVELIPKTILIGDFAGESADVKMQALVFGITFAAIFFLLSRVFTSFSQGGVQPIQAIIAGLAGTVIFVAVWVQVPALVSAWDFGKMVTDLFAEHYRLWWILGAMMTLGFASL